MPNDRALPTQQSEITDDDLRQQLDKVLEFTFAERLLNTEDHAAWQILHGALAYGRDFPVRVGREGEIVSAVDHIMAGGFMNGWDARPGDVLDTETGDRGIRAMLQEGSKAGQGHNDQWFAVLAQSGIEPSEIIQIASHEHTMADFVEQVQLDVSRNIQREWSWTIIGLTTYLPTDAKWTAADGKEWSIRTLVQLEAEQDIERSTCGGTHRLIGLAMAINHHLDQGGHFEGPWEQADMTIKEGVDKARQYQNSDGSFSVNYFARPGRSPDLADDIRTTGHMLEFLTMAMTEEQLRQPWVKRAAVHLCDVFEKTRDIDLECGALYHAAHGLVVYRQRLFGERRYVPNTGAAD